jgi:endonuclease YncB( thermonuclease family)
MGRPSRWSGAAPARSCGTSRALPRDRQGRLLAYVFTQEGTFVNAWLIEFGFAEAVSLPPNLRYQADLSRLEREAREKFRGLWMRQ